MDKDENLSDNEEPKTKKSKVEEDVVQIKPIESKEERWKRLFTKRTVNKQFDLELMDFYNRKNNTLTMKLYVERE